MTGSAVGIPRKKVFKFSLDSASAALLTKCPWAGKHLAQSQSVHILAVTGLVVHEWPLGMPVHPRLLPPQVQPQLWAALAELEQQAAPGRQRHPSLIHGVCPPSWRPFFYSTNLQQTNWAQYLSFKSVFLNAKILPQPSS